MEELGAAAAEWEVAAGVTFEVLPGVGDAPHDVRVAWSDRSADNDLFFDGVAGSLAAAEKDFISLDIAERWLMQGQPAKAKAYYLLPVLLHELGHVIGLTHSADTKAVMSPYYVEDRIHLTDDDKERAAKCMASN